VDISIRYIPGPLLEIICPKQPQMPRLALIPTVPPFIACGGVSCAKAGAHPQAHNSMAQLNSGSLTLQRARRLNVLGGVTPLPPSAPPGRAAAIGHPQSRPVTTSAPALAAMAPVEHPPHRHADHVHRLEPLRDRTAERGQGHEMTVAGSAPAMKDQVGHPPPPFWPPLLCCHSNLPRSHV